MLIYLKDKDKKIMIYHLNNPQNQGLLDDPNYSYFRYQNNYCGDAIELQLYIINHELQNIRHNTQACAICCISASIMSIIVKQQKIKNILFKIKNFLSMLNQQKFDFNEINEELQIFKFFCDNPGKITCISLPWQALKKAIESLGY
ncbi:MAG: iron-sulfur cluster assembly scaffold protein [Candidatus Phytoplasma australasiaticum]|uniref:Iron-sulfur cluster assembly scaffold protein n=2 Tax=Candidatus Phytoplasma TaxID=33926 RepID=A0ABS9M3K2_9MOLU|nr:MULTISPECIES: iron-sulfur cluster assembly scaffold protein [Phytoplasma]MCG3566849.1 iron-sulfur cluster assembly scaffold protein [Sesame phyllody phytoplasma]MDO8031248.1 iron-sulfur cluster assembly scaffold protein [Candidatus Phytoplasma australasiaticum]MDO8031679.1 iron-sulfur cluster assembly scaffold protein [Candidatus Phytoplasma australasiaticum]MDO8046735.1 iron-sulfur cluster assembly scaffold protein [Candidatus Phytoplasma australasiaticum]MDO8052552.1 iron-sulfur cluster a